MLATFFAQLVTERPLRLHRHLRASCFRTCFVRTPSQANFAPSLISLNSVFSPSGPMTVTSVRSMTKLATLELFSSASPGALYFRGPGRNQLALQNQPSLTMRLQRLKS